MEDEGDEAHFDDLDIDETQVVKIQAFVRGEQVRRWFQEIKIDFEQTVTEIEKNKSVVVEWPNTKLGIPKVRKQKRTIKIKNIHERTPDNSSRNSPNVDPSQHSVCLKNRESKEIQSGRSSVSSNITETSFKPIVNNQIEFVDCVDIQNIPALSTRHQQHTGCTVETQTSIDDNVSRPKPNKEETGEKIQIKTYDMLIQTDDLPHQTETKMSAIDSQTNHDSISQHDPKQCINRQVLEQKINKFESQLQTLKNVSSQGSVSDTEIKNHGHDSREIQEHYSPKTQKHESPHTQVIKTMIQDSTEKPIFSESPRHHRPSFHKETSVLTNVTSVWDSFSSDYKENSPSVPATYPKDPESLKEMRKNISMELLWVQQAIDSRKHYLRLKNQMREAH